MLGLVGLVLVGKARFRGSMRARAFNLRWRKTTFVLSDARHYGHMVSGRWVKILGVLPKADAKRWRILASNRGARIGTYSTLNCLNRRKKSHPNEHIHQRGWRGSGGFGKPRAKLADASELVRIAHVSVGRNGSLPLSKKEPKNGFASSEHSGSLFPENTSPWKGIDDTN